MANEKQKNADLLRDNPFEWTAGCDQLIVEQFAAARNSETSFKFKGRRIYKSPTMIHKTGHDKVDSLLSELQK